MNIADIFFAFRGESKQLALDAKKAGEQAGKTGGDAFDKSFSGRLNKLKADFAKGGGIPGALMGGIGIGAGLGAFQAVTAGIGMVTDFMGDAISKASDLAESQSKVKVVFGESAAEIEAWAETAATSMGVSNQAALEQSSTLGNLLLSMGKTSDEAAEMSMTMVQLAADLGSFNNVDPAEVLLAMRSALTGEIAPMRRFGVNLSEVALKAKAMALGISDGKGTLDATAKSTAAYALILEQTTTAQGDFARTSDGLANTTKTLNAQLDDMTTEIGTMLLPYMVDLANVAKRDLIPALKAVMANIGTVATLFDLLAKAATGDLAGIMKISEEFAKGTFLDWLDKATEATDALIAEWDSFDPESPFFTIDSSAFLEQLTADQKAALLLASNLPPALEAALMAGAPLVERGSKALLGPIVDEATDVPKDVRKALSPVPAIIRGVLKDARDDARTYTKQVKDAMTHPLRAENLGRQYAKDIAASERKRRKALREGNTAALAIIDAHLADVRRKAAALADQTWRYNIEIIASRKTVWNQRGTGGQGTNTGPRARASGGPVQRDMPYWVGENRRRELFVPETNGRIVPEHEVGGGRMDIHVHDDRVVVKTPDGTRQVAIASQTQAIRRWED